MQDTGGALEHLALAAEADKDIFTKLTEVVKALKRNNASLIMQLRKTMKINLEMAKNLNLKAT